LSAAGVQGAELTIDYGDEYWVDFNARLAWSRRLQAREREVRPRALAGWLMSALASHWRESHVPAGRSLYIESLRKGEARTDMTFSAMPNG
jgi:hypothetical protein